MISYLTACATFIFMMFYTGVSFAKNDTIDADTALLSKCEGAYLYVAQLHQMADQPGMATNTLSRAALISASNLFLNQVSGSVPGERIQFINESRSGLKEAFDENPLLASAIALACEEEAKLLLHRIRFTSRGEALSGVTLQELQIFLLEKYKQHLGL